MRKIRVLFLDQDDEWRTPWRIVSLFVLLIGSVALINAGWKAAGLPGARAAGPWTFALFAALIAGSLLLISILLLRLFDKRRIDAIGLPLRLSAWKMTAFGTLLGTLPICLLLGAAVLFDYGSVQAVPGGIDIMSVLLPTLLATLLLAAWEELGLRGYLFYQLAQKRGPAFAIVVTGVLFGLMHAGNPGANWQGLLYTAIGGVLMGVMLLRFGSLWLLVGYHFGWNAMSSGVLGLELSGMDEQASIFVSTLSGPDWLTGGSYGFEASLPAVICEVLVLGTLLFTSRSFGLRSAP